LIEPDFAVALMAIFLACSAAFADEASDRKKQEDRLQNAGQVVNEILNIPDNIPQGLLDKAKCVVVIPFRPEGCLCGRRKLRTAE